MAVNYTYDEFQKAAQNAGLLGQFSDADLKLAQSDPSAGMSLLQSKQDWNSATTDEAKAQANASAEAVRSSYGGYTGGADGSGYSKNPLSPASYQSAYADDLTSLYNQALNYGAYSYSGTQPTYTNRYDGRINDQLDTITGWQDFSYDPTTDPLYSNYRKQYTREGQRATADALGTAAASGGLASSYANTAAAQAANYYAAQMADKIPELEQLAYTKYNDKYNRQLTALEALEGAEQSDYAKYLQELSQYNTDRNFDYGVWSDAYDRILQNLSAAQLAAAESSGTVNTQKITQKSGGDDDSGGTGYDALFQAAMASGYPQSYIANHYKEYGFTSSSGIYNDYKTWAANQQQTSGMYKGLKYKDLSAQGQKISDLMDSDLTTNYNKILDMIESLTDENEQNYLLQQL
jgi:hypothetical protein